MRSGMSLALCLGIFCAAAGAAPPDLKAPAKVAGNVGEFIPIRTETAGKFTRFKSVDPGINLFPADLLTDRKATVVSAAKPGTYRIWAFTGNGDGPSEVVEILVVVGGVTPTPPGPTPDPPTPTPDGKAPIPEPGFRVLFVFESEDLTKYERGQLNAMRAKQVTDYLAEKCVKGPDGKTPEFRSYDKDTPLAAAPKLWQDVMNRPRTELPWVVISTGTTGFEGPVPYNKADPADLTPIMTLLRKYGGN